jgi:hypothetical protein
MSKGLYIGTIHNKKKYGVSKTMTGRMISHDKGNTNPVIDYYYVAVDGYDMHINNCESYLDRELYAYLENPRGSPSEYIDPKFSEITTEYIANLVEKRIKSHPLKIIRLKKEFLPLTRYNVKTVMEGIKNFPNKYLENIK